VAVLLAATALRHDAVVVHNDTDFGTLQRAVRQFNQLRLVA
jgi:predicted nucleic acid-binding protein